MFSSDVEGYTYDRVLRVIGIFKVDQVSQSGFFGELAGIPKLGKIFVPVELPENHSDYVRLKHAGGPFDEQLFIRLVADENEFRPVSKTGFKVQNVDAKELSWSRSFCKEFVKHHNSAEALKTFGLSELAEKKYEQ
jgi:hypothetical protein